jgi:hypothetical protein
MNSVTGKVKEFAGMTLGLAVFLIFLSVPLIFIAGSVWAAKNLLQPLIAVGWFAVAIDLLILLPLSMFRSIRGFAGGAIFYRPSCLVQSRGC